MNLHIRPPLAGEWPICRMLLPETFADVSSREYLLCLRDAAPRIVAAASFRRSRDAASHLRCHVVPSFRRCGVASRILGYIARSGVATIEGTAEITSEPGIAAFCRHAGLLRVDGLTTVEGDMTEMRQSMRRLRDRIGMPSGARIVPLSAAPKAEVALLHARQVVQEGTLNPWRFLMANTANMERSPVVMLDGRVVGIILWELAGDTLLVRSRAVAPDQRRNWVNVALLAEAIDTAWAAGARRVQFSYADANRDTEKLALRFRAGVTGVLARFRRDLATQRNLTVVSRTGFEPVSPP